MKKLTRRSFIRGTSVLAAGALAGMPNISFARNSLRESGIVSFQVDLFHQPLMIEGTLFVDEAKDIFGIRSFGLRGREVQAETQLPLETVRASMKTTYPWVLFATTTFKALPKQTLFVKAALEGDRFSLREVGKESFPFWIPAKDIRSVL